MDKGKKTKKATVNRRNNIEKKKEDDLQKGRFGKNLKNRYQKRVSKKRSGNNLIFQEKERMFD